MDWPGCGLPGAVAPFFISSISPYSGWATVRQALTLSVSNGWPAANRALFIPFRVPAPFLACKIIVGAGATAGGNFDVGIYDWAGTRLVSSGAVARSASSENVANITDTMLMPGRYYMAMSADSTNTYAGIAPNAGVAKMIGMRQQDTAYTLPATATFATTAAAFIPFIGIAGVPW